MKTANSKAQNQQMEAEDKALPMWQLRALRRGLIRSCVNCDNFKKEPELCNLYNARPPAIIIALGCPEWSEEIPF